MGPMKKSPERYNALAIGFHWLLAFGIIGMLLFGLYLDELHNAPNKGQLVGLHKSIGVTILLLAFLRLMWRFTSPVPMLPSSMPLWQKGVAHASHTLLYLMMFIMPLSGWIASDAAGHHPSLFGLPLPVLVQPSRDLQHMVWPVHAIGANVLWGLLALHVAAALYHHVVKGDNVLTRMLPRRK